MKLYFIKIHSADTCGGLLDGMQVRFRSKLSGSGTPTFNPICMIGPNGSGKSQLLQVIAEIFHAIFAKFLPEEEKGTPNDSINFEIEYGVFDDSNKETLIKAQRTNKRTGIILEKLFNDSWVTVEANEVSSLLPQKIIGYTSGGNETLSIPFLVSRAGYANEVRSRALEPDAKSTDIPDPRMILIDYGTNLEVLVANLLLNPQHVRDELVKSPNLQALRSFRCVIQLAHREAPSGGVQLTDELQRHIDNLKCCATSHFYDPKTEAHTFDFFVQDATHKAFGHYWRENALSLYSSFHKLAMLNDLIIPKKERDAFKKGLIERRFATRLPEPMERQKVFRFERVEFLSDKTGESKAVDYVSLSDGEHQLAQLLGTFCMVNYRNVLFLLDEPESHFNPRWRVEFISRITNIPTRDGSRSEDSPGALQDCLITTHSPFVPSDMRSDNVFIFKKENTGNSIAVRHPNIETYGSSFDTILEECFEISPPISDIPRKHIERLLNSNDIDEIKSAMQNLGESVDRMYLADRIRFLRTRSVN